MLQRRQYVRVDMAGKVAVEIAVAPDDPLQRLQRRGFTVFIHKGEEGSDKVGGAGGGGVCFAAQVVENGFDRFSVLLSGHKAGQSFAGVGNSTLCTKRISLVVPSMSVTMARIMVSPEWA